MPASRAEVATEHASRYVTRLCKHFAHKVPAQCADGQGKVDFPFGQCLMRATADRLSLHCEAPDDDALGRVRDVVGSHLERMATAVEPETPVNVTWKGD